MPPLCLDVEWCRKCWALQGQKRGENFNYHGWVGWTYSSTTQAPWLPTLRLHICYIQRMQRSAEAGKDQSNDNKQENTINKQQAEQIKEQRTNIHFNNENNSNLLFIEPFSKQLPGKRRENELNSNCTTGTRCDYMEDGSWLAETDDWRMTQEVSHLKFFRSETSRL